MMFPRHQIDVGPLDLLYGLAAQASPADPSRLADRVAREWAPAGDALACLCVRSAFHLLLEALELPEGSEVLVSAVTHPDMPRILEMHGLRPIPLDLDLPTLSPRLDLLGVAIGPKTRAILVAHLFGGRVDLEPVAQVARRLGLVLIEDCAQAFSDPGQTGSRLADVSLYSFGPLKTATALGGALVLVRDDRLRSRMRRIHERWPLQPRRDHLARVARFAYAWLATRPRVYGALAALYGRSLDSRVSAAARAFPLRPAAGFKAVLERRPCTPLLKLLERRLRGFDPERVTARAQAGELATSLLPPGLLHVGDLMLDRTHWLYPVVADDADQLIEELRAAGFDAARAASSVSVVEAPADRPDLDPFESRWMMGRLVFLPMQPEVPEEERRRLLAIAGRGAQPEEVVELVLGPA